MNVKVLQSHFELHFLNSVPDNKILDWSELAQIADDTLKCIQNEKKSITSNFSFCHNIFHICISLVHQNAALWGNGISAADCVFICALKDKHCLFNTPHFTRH